MTARRWPAGLRRVMLDQYGDLRMRWVLVFAFLLTIVLVVVPAVLLATWSQDEFDQQCTPRGGHTVSVGRGRLLCVSDDGRIIGP